MSVSACGGNGSSQSNQQEPDRIAPTVSISGPSSTGSFTSYADTIIVTGTATDNVSLSSVIWALNGGAESDVIGLASWSTPVLQLDSGENTLRVTATDASGNEASAQLVVTYIPGPDTILHGIGILGDSNSDEYRADDDRGAEYAAVTFNWVEQLVLTRGLNFGGWGTRASPRRTGFAYNWALSGATASSMLSTGQHIGLAQQVAAGDVTLAYVFIGHNDFAREKYAEIYSGTLSGAALDAKIQGVIDDITTAVDTVMGAGMVRVILVELYDYSIERPRLLANFPDPARRALVTDAVSRVNSGLVEMAEQRGVITVSLTEHGASVLGSADANGFINVGGELIDTINFGNEPHHLNLDDGSHHGGTVGNGLFANDMFVEPVNAFFEAGLQPMSDEEILETAGILP